MLLRVLLAEEGRVEGDNPAWENIFQFPCFKGSLSLLGVVKVSLNNKLTVFSGVDESQVEALIYIDF